MKQGHSISIILYAADATAAFSEIREITEKQNGGALYTNLLKYNYNKDWIDLFEMIVVSSCSNDQMQEDMKEVNATVGNHAPLYQFVHLEGCSEQEAYAKGLSLAKYKTKKFLNFPLVANPLYFATHLISTDKSIYIPLQGNIEVVLENVKKVASMQIEELDFEFNLVVAKGDDKMWQLAKQSILALENFEIKKFNLWECSSLDSQDILELASTHTSHAEYSIDDWQLPLTANYLSSFVIKRSLAYIANSSSRIEEFFDEVFDHFAPDANYGWEILILNHDTNNMFVDVVKKLNEKVQLKVGFKPFQLHHFDASVTKAFVRHSATALANSECLSVFEDFSQGNEL